jgi:diguanylate cyclase (GGDEF)-like protein
MDLTTLSDAGNYAILIIDDTPANLGLVVEYLEDHGFQVMVAQDGEEGVKRAQFVQPDIILLDVMMPGIDGFETCRRLKACASTSAIPIIFMTALAETQEKVAAFAAGGVDYVTKPFQIEEVLARVNTHLRLRAMQKQLAEQNRQLQQEIAIRKKAEAALQHAYDDLDLRIVQRTADLANVNARLKTEIIEHQQAERHIRYLAHHDGLTGLPNRALLEERIIQFIMLAEREMKNAVAVLFIDLDYFKHVNDALGHHVGDMLLCMVSTRLISCARKSDCVARLGGDEYVISMPALSDSIDGGIHAAVVADKVLESLGLPFVVEGNELRVTASIGISLFPRDGPDVEALLQAADSAMYQAKKEGGGNYKFFTQALNREAQHRMVMTNQLRHALVRGEFALWYQPQVDMESGKIFSAEALLRWRQPECGMIPPDEFIPLAEESGLILPIGKWVLQQACQQLKRWRDAGYPDLRIAVNLSTRQFYQAGFEDLVADALSESGLPADALELEITESILIQPTQDNLMKLKRLGSIGVQLSVDDFGTGYSSLAYLRQFPINAIKIDRSFVIGIGHDCNVDGLVAAIIAMAQALHLKIIAEGVDTPEQVEFLTAHGCLAAQGFYYDQAVPAEVFDKLLAEKNPYEPQTRGRGGGHDQSRLGWGPLDDTQTT